MHSSWSRFVPQKLSHSRFVDFIVDKEFLWHDPRLCRRLAIRQVHRESFSVYEGNDEATAGCLFHWFNPIAYALDTWKLERPRF
jgi:hypothetical protein